MRISDWSSDVCSSDLAQTLRADQRPRDQIAQHRAKPQSSDQYNESQGDAQQYDAFSQQHISRAGCLYPLVLPLPSCSPHGRASCRERVVTYVEISVVDGTLTKKQ